VKIVVASTFVPFVDGGANMIVRDLRHALIARGHEVAVVEIPHSARWDVVLEQTLALRLLEVGGESDAMIAVRPPAYALRHPNKRLWFIHHIRTAYDLWGSPWQEFPDGPEGLAVRDAIRRYDDICLREARSIHANSHTVAERLRTFNGIDAGVLYPPLGHPERCYWEPPEDYVVYPSRLASHKRQRLAVEAAAHLASDVRIVIAGAAEEPYEAAMLGELIRERGLERRVQLIPRWIGEDEKAELIARSLAVLYLPFDEDSYGYVSLEAAHARKAVNTCSDSGGALELISDGENGLVVAPEPASLAAAIDRLRADPGWATSLGERAAEILVEKGISWDRVIAGLLA
jgi:glycosyltransferase involved in cell wall biosynthesis